MKANLKFAVRYSETDQMGVANNSRYLDWFSEGGVAWLRGAGYEYAQWENQGIVLPVIEVHCFYKHSARFSEVLNLVTRVTRLNPRSIVFEYELFRDELLLASGSTRHFFVIGGAVRRLDQDIYAKLKDAFQSESVYR